jgi:hypothetical protein
MMPKFLSLVVASAIDTENTTLITSPSHLPVLEAPGADFPRQAAPGTFLSPEGTASSSLLLALIFPGLKFSISRPTVSV